MLIFLVWIAVLLSALALYFRQVYSRFTDFGVKQHKPFLFMGNMLKVIFRMEHFSDHISSMYNEFPEERFIGRFEFAKPCLLVRDIELVKKITIKDFEHFLDHRSFMDDNVEPLFGRNILSLKGQEWKDMRSTLSPAFTSSKIKHMIPFMVEVVEMMIRAVKNKIKNSKVFSIKISTDPPVEIDCKDLTSRYANDVIASCAFGLKVDSHTNEVNEFYEMGKRASSFNLKPTLLLFLFSASPFIVKMVIFLLWIAILLAAVALHYRQIYSRFTAFGVKQQTPVPFFGSMLKVILRMEHLSNQFDSIYKQFPEERFIGRFEFSKPCLLVRDLELAKKITIKDFEHFLDHRGLVNEDVEPLFARNLFSLKGQEWKDMRSTLSPAFTSSKIKQMVPFMEEVGERMIRAVKNKIKNSNNGSVEIDCKDLTSRYANDVIASCAFGLKVDSHTNEDNQFYEMGKTASTFKLKQMILFFLTSAAPILVRIFKLKLFSKETTDFFIDLVQNTMKSREENNIIRPDMIHLLMEAKKGQLTFDADITNGKSDSAAGIATVDESDVGKTMIHKVWSDNDLTAQAVLFFVTAFETISMVTSFTLYELAVHKDVQERLVEEIREHNVKHNGKLDFTSIQQLTYLDMIISEVLRLWPAALALDRVCSKDYNMGKPNSNATEDFIIHKGENLSIPTWSIHRDPQYFPNPNKFDPERFAEENRHLINFMAYIPFGLGPRNCIGSRFALCELKVMIYQIILNFEISPTKKTCIPAQLSTDTFNLRLKGGHGLQFKSR